MSSQPPDDFLSAIDKSHFDDTPFFKKIEKPWGYELIFTSEELPYTGKIMHINEGKRLSLQIHDKKQETQMLINGKCNLIHDNKDGQLITEEMEPNKGYTAHVGQRHRLQAITDCDIFEVSTPENGNTYRLEDDYSRETETEEMRKDPNRGWNS
jgi:mannose-6-phosphate isomerase